MSVAVRCLVLFLCLCLLLCIGIFCVRACVCLYVCVCILVHVCMCLCGWWRQVGTGYSCYRYLHHAPTLKHVHIKKGEERKWERVDRGGGEMRRGGRRGGGVVTRNKSADSTGAELHVSDQQHVFHQHRIMCLTVSPTSCVSPTSYPVFTCFFLGGGGGVEQEMADECRARHGLAVVLRQALLVVQAPRN